MLDELKPLENRFKQILYGCVEHVQATKAALYLSSSHDLNEKTYEIVTSYQFNAADRRVVTGNDDLVDRLAVKRTPFFVNGLGADQRFAEMLFRQGNDRLLAAPMFSRGRLIGFIDMRDKAAKKPFESGDVAAAARIAEEMVSVLAENKLFGLAPIALVEEPSKSARPEIVQQTVDQQPGQAGESKAPTFSAEATHAIESARQYMARRQYAANAAGRQALTESDLDSVRLILPAALAIPGTVLVAFSAPGHINNPQLVVSLTRVKPDMLTALKTQLETWLKKTGHAPHATVMLPQISYPFGDSAAALPMTTFLSAPVSPQLFEGLVFTVGFSRQPDAEAHRALRLFLRQVERAVETIGQNGTRSERQTIAERLLEPDFRKYPALVDHCRDVAAVAQRFAHVLELPATQAETVRLAALVHDVGLRLLDYDRLYRRPQLTPEEMTGLQQHPVIGAALVEPLLGADVAQAVLRHHERIDGKGYPSHLSGQQIPVAARIIQIADAWISMTSQQSYQPSIAWDEAILRLREGAGTQFDSALVDRFAERTDDIVS